MYHQVVNKTCKCCKENLPAAFFYKKEKSVDGLQDWCKDCQNKYNSDRLKLQSKRKHLRNLKRLSNYQLRNGLQYKFAEPKKNGHYRNKITYKCLTCGKEITSTIADAWNNRFDCCHKIDNNTKHYFRKSINKSNIDEVKTEKLNTTLIKSKHLDLANELKKHYPNANIVITFETCESKYPINSIPNSTFEHDSCQYSKKKGIFNWIKSLFK